MRNKAVWLFVRWRENGKQVARAAEWEVDHVVLKPIPEGRIFWMKWLDGKQQRYLRVGTDPVEAVRAYIHQSRGNVYGPRPLAPAPVAPERVTIIGAITAYLEQLEHDMRNERSGRSKSYELGEFRKFCPASMSMKLPTTIWWRFASTCLHRSTATSPRTTNSLRWSPGCGTTRYSPHQTVEIP